MSILCAARLDPGTDTRRGPNPGQARAAPACAAVGGGGASVAMASRHNLPRDTIGAARPVHGPPSAGSAVRGDSRVPRVQQKSGHREASMATARVLGFVGLGVMGEPMCRNLARKLSLERACAPP